MQHEHITTLYSSIQENSSTRSILQDITDSQNTSESTDTTEPDANLDNCLKKVFFSSNHFLEGSKQLIRIQKGNIYVMLQRQLPGALV